MAERPGGWPAQLPDPEELAARAAAYLEQRYLSQQRAGLKAMRAALDAEDNDEEEQTDG